jgi:translation initiation factor IF-3
MTLINERIRYGQVRVIDDHNNQLGILDTKEALDIARSRGLDLILVADKAQPPVCRIMDYGKFKYEKSKRDKGKAKASANELKMVRLHPRTGVHDRQILERHAEKFLRHGHKVRVVCQFRGRENAHPEIGRNQLDAVAKALDEVATVEGTIAKQGRDMTMFLVPKPGIKPLPKPAKDGEKSSAKEDDDDDDDLEEYSAPGVDDDDGDEDESETEEIVEERPIAEKKKKRRIEDVLSDETGVTNLVQEHKPR